MLAASRIIAEIIRMPPST